MNCRTMSCAFERRHGVALRCEVKTMPAPILTNTRPSCAIASVLLQPRRLRSMMRRSANAGGHFGGFGDVIRSSFTTRPSFSAKLFGSCHNVPVAAIRVTYHASTIVEIIEVVPLPLLLTDGGEIQPGEDR